MRQAWDHCSELHDIQGVIPVPLFRRNERIRGYNQAELLAERLASDIGRPFVPMLIRTRKTKAQYDLNRAQRRRNVEEAFSLHPYAVKRRALLNGLSFLMIDDICTTASTLGECAKVLQDAGVGSVKALVLARDL
jgi:ComF family protein